MLRVSAFVSPWTSAPGQTSLNAGLLSLQQLFHKGRLEQVLFLLPHCAQFAWVVQKNVIFLRISLSCVWNFIFWHPLVNMFTVA